MRNVNLFGLLATLVAQPVLADKITIGEPAYGGSGCPAGTASVVLSPDATSLSILFDQYIVEAGREVGKTLDRKSCNIAIPVRIPQGYSVSIFKVDYRGFNSLPYGGRAEFNVEYFLAGGVGPRHTERFYGPQDEEYLITNNIIAEALVWSACGADTILRSNSSMLVRTNSKRDQTLATVDSADVEAGLIYHLKWKKCYN